MALVRISQFGGIAGLIVLFTFAIASADDVADSNASSATSTTALPQLKFRKTKISVDGNLLTIEVADNDQKRQRGLMNRTHLAENEGMLFIFEDEQSLSFWMKNTLIPLDIGFFDRDQKLIDFQSMQPASEIELHPQVYISKKPAKYALEVPFSWFSRHKIKLGAKYKYTLK